MIKVARKPSADPVQEKLRQAKSLWNKEVSTFVNDLIHLKKMMNGWPSKFHPERSRIVDPIPADPATIIGSLAGDFQEIAQRGNSIIQQQVDYSKNRRKKQPKQLNLPHTQTPAAPAAPAAPAPPAPDLSQQLSLPAVASSESDLVKVASSFEEKYSLVAEASNPITRFFTKLLNPGIGFSEAARVRRVRMQLLSACAKVYKKLEDLQVSVVKSSQKSLEESNEMMHQVWRDWETVRTGFSTYKGMMPPKVPDAGGDIAPPKEVVESKKKEEEGKAKLVEQEMEKVDRAQEEGKAEPGDPDHEGILDDKPESERSKVPFDAIVGDKPRWEERAENLIDNLNENESVNVANRIFTDYRSIMSPAKRLEFIHNGVDPVIFTKLNEALGWFSLRKNKWADTVIKLHRELLNELNETLDTSESSLKEVLDRLVERRKFQERLDKQRKKLQEHEQKQKQKAQKLQEKEQERNQKIEERERLFQEKQRQKAQKNYEKEKQKKLVNVPPIVPPAPAPVLALPPVVTGPPAPLTPVPPTPVSSSPSDSLTSTDQLEVTAQAFLKKWIGKTRHQLSMFDGTSGQRLQVYDVAEEMRQTVDQIMDHLEKDINIDELTPMIGKVNNQLSSIRGLTRNLHMTHRVMKGKK